MAVWMDGGPASRAQQAAECHPTTASFELKDKERLGEMPTSEEELAVESIIDQATEMAALEKWNKAREASDGSPLNFLTNPVGFIEKFQDCADDPRCHVMYQHVSKTGGTYYEPTNLSWSYLLGLTFPCTPCVDAEQERRWNRHYSPYLVKKLYTLAVINVYVRNSLKVQTNIVVKSSPRGKCLMTSFWKSFTPAKERTTNGEPYC